MVFIRLPRLRKVHEEMVNEVSKGELGKVMHVEFAEKLIGFSVYTVN